MSLIRINRELMSINNIWRLILRRIFNPKKAGESDLYLIEHNIEKWKAVCDGHNSKVYDAFGDKAFEQAVGRRGSIIDEIEYQLQEMCKMLVNDEKGLLESKKETYRVHHIDYRKVYPNIFPECIPTPAEKAQAQGYLKRAMKEHPDEYPKPGGKNGN